MSRPIRVLIADDSPSICHLLTTYLESTPDIKVVGTAHDGQETVKVAKRVRPDVMTLNLQMPTMSGLKVLEQVMQDIPTPVIMVSGTSHEAATLTLRALKLGAVDFVFKYTPDENADPDVLRQEIIDKVKAAARAKVIRLVRPTGRTGPLRPTKRIKTGPLSQKKPTGRLPEITAVGPSLRGGVIVIGASTGGSVALRELLSTLPAEIPAAILVVQHIPTSFTRVLAAQLDRHTSLRVREARTGDRLVSRRVLLAPGDYHLLVREGQVILNQGPPVNGHCPAVDVTMQSVAQVYKDKATGVILTGEGDDGAVGMSAIHAAGGKTFAQDAASCVINSMSQRAIERGVVNHIAPPADIGRLLGMALANKRPHQDKKI